MLNPSIAQSRQFFALAVLPPVIIAESLVKVLTQGLSIAVTQLLVIWFVPTIASVPYAYATLGAEFTIPVTAYCVPVANIVPSLFISISKEL